MQRIKIVFRHWEAAVEVLAQRHRFQPKFWNTKGDEGAAIIKKMMIMKKLVENKFQQQHQRVVSNGLIHVKPVGKFNSSKPFEPRPAAAASSEGW